MGKLILIGRLAARDLRRRRIEAALLLLAFTAATTTLALGLVLDGVTNQPYLQTRAATAGPDVVLQFTPNGSAAVSRRGLAQLAALEHASGVAGSTGPYPATWVRLSANGHAAGAQVEGRETAPASIDQPKITQGSWLRGNGTAVLERSFAAALGVVPGDRVALGGRPFRLDQIMLVVTVMLAVLAAINAIFVTWACVRDLRYSSALTRALGATRRQVTAGLVTAQALPAFAGAAGGIPLGIGLSVAAQHGGPVTCPPVAGTIAVVAGSVAGIIALTIPAANTDTRSPITQTLREA